MYIMSVKYPAAGTEQGLFCVAEIAEHQLSHNRHRHTVVLVERVQAPVHVPGRHYKGAESQKASRCSEVCSHHDRQGFI